MKTNGMTMPPLLTALNKTLTITARARAGILSVTVLLLCLLGTFANAEELVGWEVSGLSGYGASPLTPATVAANLIAVGLTRGSGVGTSGSAAANAWGGTTWDAGNSTAAAAIGANDFVTFSVTANTGYKVSFTTIPAYNIRRSSTGPSMGQWQYKVGSGTFTDIGSPITWGTTTSSSGNAQAAIDLSGITALQSVPSGTTVTFRIVPYLNGGTGTAGTWYVNNISSGHDLQVVGTVDVDGGTPPTAPVANDALAIGSTAFTANWTASSGATTYLLDVATDNGFTSFVSGYNNLDVGNVTNANVTGLTASTTYYYRVRASNTGGTSPDSNIKSVTTSGAVAATKMTVTLPGEATANAGTANPQTAGIAFNVTLTALLDDSVTVDTTYSGSHSITFSGPTGSPVYPGSVTFTSGIGTASITLSKAETTTISATDGLVTGIASSTVTVNPGTYTWTATSGTASWTNATSWTPNRIAPGTEDILLFNQGGASTATEVPASTIGSLQISNTTAITLQAASVGTLNLARGANALVIGSGSALNVVGSSALSLSLPTGSTGNISGSVDFAGGAHKLLVADASGLTFQTGGTFTANTGFSGNAFGTTALNSIVFASGSTYVQKAGSNPFGASQPSSVVVFQTGSLYRVEANAAPSFSGRTYANLEINAGAFTQSSTGGGLLSIDDLTITAGTLNLNLTGGINIKGNVTVAGGQTLTFSPTASGPVTFNGTTPQTINNAGTLSFSANSTVSVPAGSTVLVEGTVAVAGPLNVDGTLGGSGAITGAGAVTVSASGTLAPGASIGTLTFDTAPALNGLSFFELDRAAGPNADELASTGATLNFSGVLTITNIGAALVDGDTFTLFAAPTLSGTFTETNLPPLSGSLAWDTTALGTTGVIKVVSTGTPPPPVSPTIAKLSFSAGNVILSGTNNAGAGGTYTLLSSTNLALPRSSWTAVTNGTFDASGNFALTNTVGTDKSRFYILQVP